MRVSEWDTVFVFESVYVGCKRKKLGIEYDEDGVFFVLTRNGGFRNREVLDPTNVGRGTSRKNKEEGYLKTSLNTCKENTVHDERRNTNIRTK